jgi:hypothetical protein
MKTLLIGWVLPTVILLSGCLSSTAYGEDQVPRDAQANEVPGAVSKSEELTAAEPAETDSAETADPVQPPARLAYPGRDYLYLSDDRGQSWDRLDIKPMISDATYITAAAANPSDPNHIVVGTSYYGLFESRDSGASWRDLDPDARLAPLYHGAGFYDEIAALVFSPDGSELFIRTGFDGPAFRWSPGQGSASEFDPSQVDEDLLYAGYPGYRELFAAQIASGETWPKSFPVPPSLTADSVMPSDFVRDLAWQERRAAAADKYGIYINAWQASSRLDEFIDYVSRSGFNSVVVDFKDDQGLLRYASELETARAADTVRPLYDARELIDKFHEAGIYVIARIVVFKDKGLYAYDDNRYALWDSRLDEPWGVYRQRTPEATEENPEPEPYWEQVEYWVDPYSEFVRDYNIAIASELEQLGVDEIQFDYIRFPSDGRVRDIVTRFLLDENGERAHVDRNSQRVSILSTFLSEARETISIPIGTDVFGFNAWSRMSYLGQDIEAISHYVDVISPMSYPSHYPRSFYETLSYLDRAALIYNEGTRRARKITGDRVLIRQYVQAFLIGGELRFEEPTYFDYLNRQLRATIQAGGSGFTLWNNSGRYYMVDPDTVPEIIRQAERIARGLEE